MTKKFLSNPHGSDVTLQDVVETLNNSELSNPHGSDVTIYFPLGSDKMPAFLTHTVQM